jgi:hypothetical protein
VCVLVLLLVLLLVLVRLLDLGPEERVEAVEEGRGQARVQGQQLLHKLLTRGR